MMIGGSVLGVAVATLLIVPTTRHFVFGTLRGEGFQNGRFVSQWVDDLSSEDDHTRLSAMLNIEQMGRDGRPALPALLRVMREDSSPRLRSAAAFATYKIMGDLKFRGEIHATEATEDLIGALSDDDPVVRMNAAMALGTLGSDARSAVPALTAAIQRKENQIKVLTFPITVREQMMVVLGFIGPDARDAVLTLEEALGEKDDMTRTMAARALGKIGPDAKRAVPKLLALAQNEEEFESVHEAAREAVKLIDAAAAAKLEQK
jgi:HEAT repeat protein